MHLNYYKNQLDAFQMTPESIQIEMLWETI